MYFNRSKLHRHLGFTLIELLVVISIIGVLTAIILPNMMGMRERSRDSQRKSSLQELKTALRLYYNDYQAYPFNDAQGHILGCGDGDTATICNWGETFTYKNTTYMNELPSDSTKTYYYERRNSGDSFRAGVELENGGDQDIAKSQARCGTIAGAPSNTYYVCSD
jgi:type II secretion system protein G